MFFVFLIYTTYSSEVKSFNWAFWRKIELIETQIIFTQMK